MTTAESKRGMRKRREGKVVSDRMDKTVVVRVDRRIRHPLYGKEMIQSRRYHVHDENNEAGIGDRVRIQETRPRSKRKHWRLLAITRKAVLEG